MTLESIFRVQDGMKLVADTSTAMFVTRKRFFFRFPVTVREDLKFIEIRESKCRESD